MIFKKPNATSSNGPLTEGLSPEVLQLLAHERVVLPESQALRLRAVARARSVPSDSRTVVRRNRVWWRWRFVPITGLGLALASASWAAWQELEEPAPVIDPSPLGSAIVERARTIAALIPAEQGRIANEIARSLATSEEPRSAQSPSRAPSTSQPESLELVLLQTVRVALTRSEYAKALGVLAEHQRRFPSTSLGEEREALRIRALEGIGRTDEARNAGEKFRERYPRSVLSPQLGEAGRAQ